MENNVIGIDQGDVVLFSDFEHEGEMWTGDGSPNTRMTVAFSEKYIDRPVVYVYVSVSMLDASNETNIRFDVQAEDIANAGFDIVFRTWGDTKGLPLSRGMAVNGRRARR